jgi:hypothetical protein
MPQQQGIGGFSLRSCPSQNDRKAIAQRALEAMQTAAAGLDAERVNALCDRSVASALFTPHSATRSLGTAAQSSGQSHSVGGAVDPAIKQLDRSNSEADHTGILVRPTIYFNHGLSR